MLVRCKFVQSEHQQHLPHAQQPLRQHPPASRRVSEPAASLGAAAKRRSRPASCRQPSPTGYPRCAAGCFSQPQRRQRAQCGRRKTGRPAEHRIAVPAPSRLQRLHRALHQQSQYAQQRQPQTQRRQSVAPSMVRNNASQPGLMLRVQSPFGMPPSSACCAQEYSCPAPPYAEIRLPKPGWGAHSPSDLAEGSGDGISVASPSFHLAGQTSPGWCSPHIGQPSPLRSNSEASRTDAAGVDFDDLYLTLDRRRKEPRSASRLLQSSRRKLRVMAPVGRRS